jgi:hypothetical protein
MAVVAASAGAVVASAGAVAASPGDAVVAALPGDAEALLAAHVVVAHVVVVVVDAANYGVLSCLHAPSAHRAGGAYFAAGARAIHPSAELAR